MSTYSEITQAIHEGVRTRIRDGLGVAVQEPGTKGFVPPRDAQDEELPWVRFHIVWTSRAAELLFRPLIRGTLVLSVFVPLRVGTGPLTELVDGVIAAIDAGDMGPVTFDDPAEVKHSPPDLSERTGWLQENVFAPFRNEV